MKNKENFNANYKPTITIGKTAVFIQTPTKYRKIFHINSYSWYKDTNSLVETIMSIIQSEKEFEEIRKAYEDDKKN